MTIGFRKKIEKAFEVIARWLFHNRLKTLLVMVIIVAALASNLPNITLDTSTEGFLHEDDPILVTYNQFRDQFGRDEMIVISVNPIEVFDLNFLKKLKALHDELKAKVPHVDDINSLINARNTYGKGAELIVEDLLEEFPKTEEELAALKKHVLSNENYKNLVISEDGKFTAVLIKTDAYTSEGQSDDDALSGFEDNTDGKNSGDSERVFLTDAENNETVMAVREITEKYNAPDFKLKVAGSPIITNDLKRAMMNDMRRFMVMAVGTIFIMLFLLFRRVSGVFLPLVVVLLSLLSTVGIMAMVGTAIKLPTQILPSFLLAVGVGDSVHVLALFYRRLAHGDGKEDAIAYAIGHSGLAIFLTSLTTAAGLGSFAWAEVAPIADLGVFASGGVMLAFVYTVILLPALISLTPINTTHTENDHARHKRADDLLTAIADFSTTHPRKILLASAILLVISLAAATMVRFSHNPLVWFPDNHEIKQATTLVDSKMRGTSSMEVVIDTGKENGLYDPTLLNKLESLPQLLEKEITTDDLFVGKTVALSDMLKEINRALNEDRSEHYAIPQDRDLVAQELLLFENSGSDDLEDLVDSQFSKGRMIVKVPWQDAYSYGSILRSLKTTLNEEFKGMAEITLTGMVPMMARTLQAAINSAAKSYTIALVVITIMMILLVGNLKLGLISMIPNLAPIIAVVGIMGIFDFPMDMFTMLIGSIAIGLAVDDTVHFMSNFRRYHHETGDVAEAVRNTLLTTGRAMLVTTIVLSVGFFTFMFATMNNLFNFGLLVGSAIIFALLADFFLAPAIMSLIKVPVSASTEEFEEADVD